MRRRPQGSRRSGRRTPTVARCVRRATSTTSCGSDCGPSWPVPRPGTVRRCWTARNRPGRIRQGFRTTIAPIRYATSPLRRRLPVFRRWAVLCRLAMLCRPPCLRRLTPLCRLGLRWRLTLRSRLTLRCRLTLLSGAWRRCGPPRRQWLRLAFPDRLVPRGRLAFQLRPERWIPREVLSLRGLRVHRGVPVLRRRPRDPSRCMQRSRRRRRLRPGPTGPVRRALRPLCRTARRPGHSNPTAPMPGPGCPRRSGWPPDRHRTRAGPRPCRPPVRHIRCTWSSRKPRRDLRTTCRRPQDGGPPRPRRRPA